MSVTRRTFLQRQALAAAAAALPVGVCAADSAKPVLRLGLVTDLHYVDREPRAKRYYRDAPAKLAAAMGQFAAAKTDAIVCLGDIVDTAADAAAETRNLRRMAEQLAAGPGQRHYVVGNHCVRNITKVDFLKVVGQPRSYYSFDLNGIHLVILDACFRGDGTPYGGVPFRWQDANVPRAELDWLADDLKKTPHKTLVFVHQCLDLDWPFGVVNAAQVREILEGSSKVLAVLQGHFHQGNYQRVRGLHYATLAAMVEGPAPENNAYALLDVLPNGGLRLTGFGRQKSFDWAPTKAS